MISIGYGEKNRLCLTTERRCIESGGESKTNPTETECRLKGGVSKAK
jgi:hypothetical protein